MKWEENYNRQERVNKFFDGVKAESLKHHRINTIAITNKPGLEVVAFGWYHERSRSIEVKMNEFMAVSYGNVLYAFRLKKWKI
jgi:hypothetical protein